MPPGPLAVASSRTAPPRPPDPRAARAAAPVQIGPAPFYPAGPGVVTPTPAPPRPASESRHLVVAPGDPLRRAFAVAQGPDRPAEVVEREGQRLPDAAVKPDLPHGHPAPHHVETP